MAKGDQNIPVAGMTDAHPLNVKQNQYTLMLNGNIMTDISSAVTLTNEHSNYLCNNLPDGFKVIGTMFIHEDNVVYLWLVNPLTGASEVGYLGEYIFTDVNDLQVPNKCDECEKKQQEAPPLETQVQTQLCTYTPIVTDGPCCSLGFNIDFPIRRGVFKKDNCGDSIYFTDFLNPPRVLKLQPGSHLPDNTIRCVIGYTPSPCVEPIYDNTLPLGPTYVDCIEIQIWPTTTQIHVTPTVIGAGGTLVAGVYQMGACYADKNGQRATRTFIMSNPVSVFDPNQTITDQVNYPTDLGIQFALTNIDNTEYKYINIFVAATTGGVSTYRLYDTIDISILVDSELQWILSDFERGKPATIDDILQISPVYELAQEITTAGNSLLLANLTGPPDLNLQKAVINLSPFIKWKTYESSEDLYKDGAFAADYRTYMRDEQYALGIVFERNNTLDTCVYPLVGRAINSVVTSGNYTYSGYWIAEYSQIVGGNPYVGYTALQLVTYQSSTYASASANNTTTPGAPGSQWILITALNYSTYGVIGDEVLINKPDAFQFPGCAPDPTYNETWKVYNTAYNRGFTCGYSPTGVQCIQTKDSLTCSSFTVSLPTISYTVSSGVFAVGDVVTGGTSGAAGTIYFVANGIIALTGVAGGPYKVGETITGAPLGATGTVTYYIAGNGNQIPADCYVNISDIARACSGNYPVAYNDASVEPTSLACSPNVAPNPTNACCCTPTCPPNVPCIPNNVRSATYAAGGGAAHPLCIDAALAQYNTLYNTGANALGVPYAVLTGTTPVQLSAGGTNQYGKYVFGNLVSSIPNMADPLIALNQGGLPPSYSGCLAGVTGSPTIWLWNTVTLPSNPPTNYLGANPASIVVTPNSNCVYYQSPQISPLMFFLGDDLGAGNAGSPGNNPNGGCGTFAAWASNYWGITYNNAQTNSTPYQSYWYNFYATSAAGTLVIKVKLFYKDGESFAAGDLRIDVYKDSPTGSPMYSTGNSTATFYYDGSGTGGDVDAGVLIIGDVCNSTGDTHSAGQTQLIAGAQYFVHISLLGNANTGGRGKVNNAQQNPAGSAVGNAVCPCYLPNYAWANICINAPTSDSTCTVALPVEYQLQCNYDLYYRMNSVPNPNCNIQPYQFGDFGYWEAQTKLYPNSIDQNGNPLWGQLCGEPIRHFKFPDCLVAPLMDQDPTIVGNIGAVTDYPFNAGRTAKIYPVGLKIDTDDVVNWLGWAATPVIDTFTFPNGVSVPGGGLISQTQLKSITGYKIVRGNRATNKSIPAKGILMDMWKYQEYDWVSNTFSTYPSYFSNYPFNDILSNDPYLTIGATGSGPQMQPPNQGKANDRFAFHSPDCSFNAPTIGAELKLECGMFGSSLGYFYQVQDHPKYVLLSNRGIGLAAALAAIQLAADLLILIGELLGNYDVGFTDTVPVGSIVGIVGAALNEVPKFFIYAQQWETLIEEFGVPQNFAYYYAGVGNYHSSGILGQIFNSGNKRRLILNGTYLLGGNVQVNEQGSLSKINNYEREDSVYFHINSVLTYQGPVADNSLRDTSKFIMSQTPQFSVIGNNPVDDDHPCGLVDRKSQVASNYASMKYYLPDQYGGLQDIEWLYTGVFASLGEDQGVGSGSGASASTCDIMLGGDEFICRFTKYIKLPFFLDNPVGTLSPVDWQYYNLANITSPTYFFNSVGESALNSSSIQFKEVENNFNCDRTGSGMYLKGNMYLFSYGVVSFLCESDFNLNFRRCINVTTSRGFYPYQSDVQNVTQQYLVPIETPNSYLYNRDYSVQNKINANVFCKQPTVYHNQPCVTAYRNRVINSIPDLDPDFYHDNWKIFLGGDYFDFPLSHGFLNGIYGIERDRVLVLLSETNLVFNASYKMDTDAGTVQLGVASLFAQKPEQEIQSDIGFGGTESHAFVSTPLGHFWADPERHKIFVLPPQKKSPYAENNPVAISESLDTFFLTNLPFFILRDFPTFNTDNPYKDIGITMDWDYRFGRLFITKLDYKLLPEWKGQVTYVDDGSGRGGSFFLGDEEITLTDTTYFCNKSWTIAYSPALKTWVSYYSFVPNYYVGHSKYLQTGINFVRPGADEVGIWNHYISNKSYQVFYGNLYPFIIDVVVQEQLYNKQLQSLEYQADYRRFQNDYDYFYSPVHTFNKMVIWTENQNSGNLNLVPQKKNDFSQVVRYPSYGPDSTTILVTRKIHSWRVNQFWDMVANKESNIPPMILGCNPYLKTVNSLAIWYNRPTFTKEHICSDYVNIRFENDKYSNFSIIFKWGFSDTIKSYT